MFEIIDKWKDKHDIGYSYEGEAGLKRFEKLLNAIGYEEDRTINSRAVVEFLIDNPGAIQALEDWVIEVDLPEWKEGILHDTPDDPDDEEEEDYHNV
jgi:hypothetical protein